MLVYFVAAVGPAAALLIYIYNQDKVEKEPWPLLGKLVGFGALAAIAAIILENIADPLIVMFIDPWQKPFGYTVVSAFIGIALMEECAKYLFLYLGSWKDPHFNFRFDGIVYAVCISLGFAALENIGYVFGYGLAVAPTRALLSIPGHLSFAVIMGYFYSRAKIWSRYGETAGARNYRILGVVMATLMHGFYDCCLMIGTDRALVVFLLFVAALFYFVFRLVRSESRTDEPV